MELEQYIKVIRKNIFIIAALTALGAGVAFYFSTSFRPGYQASQTFYISENQSQQTPDVAQNSYFTQEKARNFTDTAVSILQSADFKNSLAARGTVAASKVAPQVIRITATATDSVSAKNLMETTITTFNAKVKELSQAPSQLKPVGWPSEPQIPVMSPKIIVTFGALAGFTAALIVIGLKIYFRL